jgi:hypothetical protein
MPSKDEREPAIASASALQSLGVSRVLSLEKSRTASRTPNSSSMWRSDRVRNESGFVVLS